MTDGRAAAAAAREGEAPRPRLATVFAGLMLGMFLAALNQTIIAPAMPRIVAELGGMEHYSWIAVSALLASTVIVPIVGKLSDLYGRKRFYVGGIVVFMASSLVAGVAPTFEVFMLARVLEGFGMGTMMPLSQAIIGDLVPPRERGKYQGLMGGVFGLASVVGPFVGGWVTDGLGWRWLFFLNLPMGLVALGFIIPFMKLPHVRRAHRVDFAGFVTLALGLTAVLLATVWGGTEYPWGSPVIVGLFALGGLSLVAFGWVETRAAEPVLPPRLWRNDIFVSANVAVLCVAMAMFGGIYFIPVFVQGVLGASVTGSGAVLTPMMLSIVFMSATSGWVISRTGRYKPPVLLGVALVFTGFLLLAQMDRDTTYATVVRDMVFVGLGLGMSMQTFVLAVQNSVGREDLGTATAATQLFRSIGSSVGTAVLGSIMTQRMAAEMAARVPPGSVSLPAGGGGGELGAGAVLDPATLSHLPPAVLEAVREALAASLHPVFVAALPAVGVAFVAALFLREIPLRRTVGPETAEEGGKEILAQMAHAGADDAEPVLGRPDPAYRGRAAFVGLTFRLLAARSGGDRLGEILRRVGEGDEALGRKRLDALGCRLLDDCGEDGDRDDDRARDRDEDRVRDQVEDWPRVEDRARSRNRDEDRTRDGNRRAPAGVGPAAPEPADAWALAVADARPGLRTRVRELMASGGKGLAPDDLEALERLALAACAALLLDGEGKPKADA